MVLKEEKITIDGKDLIIHEISFMGKMILSEKTSNNDGKLSNIDLYKECMSKEDWKKLNDISRNEGDKIVEAINKVNGWGDFRDTTTEKNGQ